VKSSCLENKRNSDQEERNKRYPSRFSTVLANSLRRRRSVSESDVTTKKHVEFLDKKYAEEREKSIDCDKSEFQSLHDEKAEVNNDGQTDIQVIDSENNLRQQKTSPTRSIPVDDAKEDAIKINTTTDDPGVDEIVNDCVSDTEPVADQK